MNNKHTGSDFNDFLQEEGILEEVTARALKRMLSLQILDAMEQSHLTKTELAQRMATSRSQVDRLLDPDYKTVTLDSLEKLAHAVGRQLRIELA